MYVWRSLSDKDTDGGGDIEMPTSETPDTLYNCRSRIAY
jgi:hypothetical protein